MRLVRGFVLLQMTRAFAPRAATSLQRVRLSADVGSSEFLASLEDPFVLDVRDAGERDAGKGGPPASIAGAAHVPLNVDGEPQSARLTTADEFAAKLAAAGVELPADRPIVTHCGSGGRGGKAAAILRGLGYDAHNGGSPANVAAALAIAGATYP